MKPQNPKELITGGHDYSIPAAVDRQAGIQTSRDSDVGRQTDMQAYRQADQSEAPSHTVPDQISFMAETDRDSHPVSPSHMYTGHISYFLLNCRHLLPN